MMMSHPQMMHPQMQEHYLQPSMPMMGMQNMHPSVPPPVYVNVAPKFFNGGNDESTSAQPILPSSQSQPMDIQPSLTNPEPNIVVNPSIAVPSNAKPSSEGEKSMDTLDLSKPLLIKKV